MRHLIQIVEDAQMLPSWLQDGEPVDIFDPRWDAAEYLEGDEFDFDWRLCRVPMELLAPKLVDFQPYPTVTEPGEDRLAAIRRWFEASGGPENALEAHPLILTWDGAIRWLDGYHRAFLAREAGLHAVAALVGTPK